MASLLKQQGIATKAGQCVDIIEVYYMGDAGGISCGLKLPDSGKSACVVSLTHLDIPPGHLLARDIMTYQNRRRGALGADAMVEHARGQSKGE